jgi:predicted O-methyltransferase YrrM
MRASSYSTSGLADFLAQAPGVHADGTVTWGISEETLRFLAARVEANWKTLETGAGLSTLLFAFKGTAHTCITPDRGEVERLKAYCRQRQISTDRIRFITETSQQALPGLRNDGELDLVVIDGGHGFPVPFVDWFLTAPRLKLNGILVVDDTQLWTGEVLRDFLLAERQWKLEQKFVQGVAFRKIAHDVEKEWNEQPYVHDRSLIWDRERGAWRRPEPFKR